MIYNVDQGLFMINNVDLGLFMINNVNLGLFMIKHDCRPGVYDLTCLPGVVYD